MNVVCVQKNVVLVRKMGNKYKIKFDILIISVL